MKNQPLVVLITGASSGMGLATALHLHEKGYRVYGTARRPEKYEVPFALLAMDYTDEESIRAVAREVLDREGRIDVLINNAGRGMIGPLAETPTDDLRALYQTNVFGPVKLIQEVLPSMHARGQGLIINISSIAGFAGLPFRGTYSSSKAAVMILSETLRFELHGSGIRVTDIAPGDFRTGIAAKRFYAPNRPGSPYNEIYQRILDQIDNEVDKGLPPEMMAHLIEKIIRTPRPKMQYRIGPWMQKLLPTAKVLLPQRLFEKVILKMYGLD